MDEADIADMELKAMKEDINPDKLTAYQKKQRKKQQDEILKWVKGY